jgi:hypothetical protein
VLLNIGHDGMGILKNLHDLCLFKNKKKLDMIPYNPNSPTTVPPRNFNSNVNLQHIWSIFPWRIRQLNTPEKNGRRKFGHSIYSIFWAIPSLSHTVEIDT